MSATHPGQQGMSEAERDGIRKRVLEDILHFVSTDTDLPPHQMSQQIAAEEAAYSEAAAAIRSLLDGPGGDSLTAQLYGLIREAKEDGDIAEHLSEDPDATLKAVAWRARMLGWFQGRDHALATPRPAEGVPGTRACEPWCGRNFKATEVPMDGRYWGAVDSDAAWCSPACRDARLPPIDQRTLAAPAETGAAGLLEDVARWLEEFAQPEGYVPMGCVKPLLDGSWRKDLERMDKEAGR